MKTADYKRAAVAIQSALVDLHFLRAEQWRAVGNHKAHAAAFRDASHALCRAIILDRPDQQKAASKIARFGNYVYDMAHATNPFDHVRITMDFIDRERGHRYDAVHYLTAGRGFAPGGIVHTQAGESEESFRARIEKYESILNPKR